MKCKCGYKGDPEFGDFKDDEIPLWIQHIRCPECKSTRHIIIETWERVKMAILYPEYCSGSPDWVPRHGKHIKTKKAIMLLNAGPSGIGGYSIYCPVCQWGEGGGLEQEKVEELRKLYAEKVKEVP